MKTMAAMLLASLACTQPSTGDPVCTERVGMVGGLGSGTIDCPIGSTALILHEHDEVLVKCVCHKDGGPSE